MDDASLLAILGKYWGYDSFRPLQLDIIRSVLAGHDTLGLMPTGGGKSITFQVPGLSFETGVTIVVTPLISLMKDQVDNLRRRHIKAVYFHSGMTAKETRLSWESLVNDRARFLYVSPERLKNERFLLELRHIEIKLIVVDEAHCISQWGYDFRPAYLNIKVLRRLKPGIPVLALTATATPKVAEDIAARLEFRNGNVFRKSFARDNISYLVRKADTKINDIFHILSRTAGTSIVYVRSRKRCREIAEYLTSCGISATYYHAGLDHALKEERQNAWQADAVRVMVATNAFGMGIDKPDVRVVIHFDMPPSLEEYYQEAGRAGRDGLPSFAVLLVAKSDQGVMRRRVTEAFPPRDIIKKTYERVCIFLHVSIGEGFEKLSEFDIDTFCANFNLQQKQCRNSLRLLSQAGYLNFIEDYDSRSRVKIICTREELYNIRDLSPEADLVLSTLLRMYTGLFFDYVYVSENEIARASGIDSRRIYEALLELSRHKVASYIPHSGIPLMFFPTAREETSAMLIPKSVYEERREIMSQRVEKMLDYAYNSSGCRVKRMLAYFGEENASDCGKCDVCRDNRRKKASPASPAGDAESVARFLRSCPSGATAPIIGLRCSLDAPRLSRALSFLCNEGFAEFRDNIYYPL